MAGIVTRIGQWIDERWEEKATRRDIQEQESKCSERHIGALAASSDVKAYATAEYSIIGKALADTIKQLSIVGDDLKKIEDAQQPYYDPSKDLADLKTRIERIEVYAGMTRKVDPTKPPVAKSAFSM